jgi:hypothetical protein
MRRIRARIWTCVALASVFSISPAFAFDLALMGGATASQRMTTTTSETKSDGLLGYGGGFQVNLPVASQTLTGEFGAFYLQRNVGFGTGNEIKSSMIQVPALMRLNVWKISLGAGAYFGYGIGKIQSQISGVSSETSYSEANASPLDVGALGSLNFTFPVGSSLGLIADARYSYGLKNLTKTADAKVTHNDMALLVGLRFGGPGAGAR